MNINNILQKLNIQNFNFKDHEFKYIESFCVICFKGVSDERFNTLKIGKDFLIKNKDYCGGHHCISNRFKCIKCNIHIELYERKNNNTVCCIENFTYDLNLVQKEKITDVFSLDGDKKYLYCADYMIKSIIE